MATKSKQPDKWSTMANTERKRPMVTMTLDPLTIADIDAMKGDKSRGEVVDELVAKAMRTRRRGAG